MVQKCQVPLFVLDARRPKLYERTLVVPADRGQLSKLAAVAEGFQKNEKLSVAQIDCARTKFEVFDEIFN